MKNSIAILNSVVACVWCGAAFLRSLVEKTPTQARDGCVSKCIPSLRTIFIPSWRVCTLTTPSTRMCRSGAPLNFTLDGRRDLYKLRGKFNEKGDDDVQ